MKWINHLRFRKDQVPGILALGILMFLIFALVHLDRFRFVHATYDFTAVDTIVWKQNRKEVHTIRKFNPNEPDSASFTGMGLSPYLAARIIRYRASGGIFKKPEDLLKIYGMDSSWFEEVMDSVYIPASLDRKPAAIHPFLFDPNRVDREMLERMNLRKPLADTWLRYLEHGGKFRECDDLKKIYGITGNEFRFLVKYCRIKKLEPKKILSEIIELNEADSLTLQQLYGIGPVFAHRIVRYRKRLGGFCYPAQLREVYGLDSILYLKIIGQVTIDSTRIIPIYINQCEFKELLGHPYFNYEQVKEVFNYRKLVGDLRDENELFQLEHFNPADKRKIRPYIIY